MKQPGIFLILAVVNLTAIQFVSAQITQGTAMIGGTISFNSQRSDAPYNLTNKNQLFTISPTFGKAVRQNLIIGVDLRYSNNHVKEFTNGYMNDTKANTFGLSFFARSYKNLGKSGFYLYLHNRVGADISKSKNTRSTGGWDLNTNGLNIGLGVNPGIAYAVTKKVHIETGLDNLFWLGYSSSRSGYDAPQQPVNKSSGFNANLGLGNSTQWSVGIKFFFSPQ